MLKDKDVNKLCYKYVLQTLCIFIILSGIISSLHFIAGLEGLFAPTTVAFAFAVVVESADAFIWGNVKKSGDEGLPTFYTAVSGFRMLLALATLVVCYLVVGSEAMTEYCMVFMTYYLVMIGHHSIFFSRLSNSHTSCDNENK